MELYERVAEKLGWKVLDETGPLQWYRLPGEHDDYEGYVAQGTGEAMLAMLEAMKAKGWEYECGSVLDEARHYAVFDQPEDEFAFAEPLEDVRWAPTLPEAVAQAVDAAL